VTGWTCERCEGVSVADLRRAGVYVEPVDPDARCPECGTPLAAAVRTALLLAQLRDRLAVPTGGALVVQHRAADTTAPSARRRNMIAGILSGRAAARRLGIGRDTLARLVALEVITPVPKGSRQGFRAADVEALIERGYKLPDASPRGVPAKRSRRRGVRSDDAAIQAKLAEF
jgi:hypothetical protein